MISLETVRDLISSLDVAEDDHVYMSKLDTKKEQSIGCYHLNRGTAYHPSIGGSGTYETSDFSFLVHWNESPRETEAAAQLLFDKIAAVKDVTVNDTRILFILPIQNGPIDVDKDEYGICEYVIEATIYFEERN